MTDGSNWLREVGKKVGVGGRVGVVFAKHADVGLVVGVGEADGLDRASVQAGSTFDADAFNGNVCFR